ncbi:hypothetical protein C8R43DRAFT_122366 [Mycena crocata]|nr:hypothetical protein C8R43DRAFT_122366 [Mycena crocata]
MTSYYPTGVTHAGTPRRQNPFLASDPEDEDESIGVDSIATEPVVSLLIPVGNIQEEFEAAVKEGFDFDGEFAVCKRYAMGVAPNPCLEIDGLGTVGLPLSERDARAIISACKPARLPSGNTELSGIWEMSAEKIHLDNPAWDTWIEKTAGATASRALGAVERARKATPWAAAAAPATFAARKLVIHEAGSSGATHVGRADPTDKIGDLTVILPGRHDGGQLQFRHAGASTAFNSAPESGRQTTIIASYTGVTHTLSSITSGYRLSIVYDIHEPAKSGGSRGSSLPEMHTAHERLRTILRSWKEGASDDAAPKSLVCLLQNKYHKAPNFSADSLTAGDALLVSHLRPVAREFGFRILLGHIDYDVAVEAQAPAEGDAAYEDDYWGAGIRKRDQEDYKDTGESSTYINFTLVVDLGGMPVGLKLELHPEDLLNGSVTDMPPDRKAFDREDRYEATRTSAVFRTQVYNRNVVLLWPKDGESDCKVTTGDVFDYASMKLKDSITSTPTRREKLLVKNLLVWCTFHHPPDKLRPAMRVLLAAACRWNDSEILSRALKAGKVDKNIDILGADCLVTAIGAFGWDTLKDL